jgi:hypothetical protein
MQQTRRLKTVLIVVPVLALIGLVVAALINSSRTSTLRSPLSDAVEAGESAVTSIDRGHESYTNFAGDEESVARDLLKAAQTSQEAGNGRLAAARHSGDDYVLAMTDNYGLLLNSSYVITLGMDKLLSVSNDLHAALDCYGEGKYEEAARKAAACLDTLGPLVDDFRFSNESLNLLNYRYVASGQRDKVKYAVVEYREAMGIYLQYFSLLDSMKTSADYLKKMGEVGDLFGELQHAIASKDYQKAQQLLDEMSSQLEQLKGQDFQNQAAKGSQLDPSQLSGSAASTAEDMKNQLKDTASLEAFENYLESLRKYTEASSYADQNDTQAAENAIQQGLSGLGSGQGLPSDLHRYYDALRGAFTSLLMLIRGQPDQG